ncbi:hypothetical protein B0A52_08607 [Exophiala mesophila]|uniref:Alpha-1,3/1,6-mannosyltransferase ALG2 n=1 Tax=Exophiala mesophila TaxID=212818 RepID=A0A438MWB1_EXOME|nr:hypothetical protein B0A52_08607 [Exophiala mesophila]
MSSKARVTNSDAKSPRKRIVFFHPDLGIGGAERLIIDAAVGLQDLGHKVTIFTSHCDPTHCFDEARDGTLDVRVRGNTLFPPTILNRFHILLAILRQLHLVFSIAIFGNELQALKPDVFLVDQLSACVPLLRWLFPRRQRTLFYCHFPDQLLADRGSSGLVGLLKKSYRLPFDVFEGWSMSASDKLVVNSNFTKAIASKLWPSMESAFDVVYPGVNLETSASTEKEVLWSNRFKILLSINRFERKKDVGLAVRAYGALDPEKRKGTRLVICGGYDQRVTENVQYHKELVDLAESHGLVTATAKTVPTALAIPNEVQVLFLLSVPGPFKQVLLQNARLLLYTPQNEHFGIVPVEAMQQGVAVLASNTGGPLETIVEGETGWLRDVAKVDQWTAVIERVLHELSPLSLQKMASSGRLRASSQFSNKIMAINFDLAIEKMAADKRSTFVESNDIFVGVGLVLMFVAALVGLAIKSRTGKSDPRLTEFARARRMHPDADANVKVII